MADVHISDLAQIAAILGNENIPIEDSSDTLRVTPTQLKGFTIGNTDISMVGNGTVTGAIKALYDEQNVTIVTVADVASLPVTKNDASITSNMVCVKAELSNPAVYISADVITGVGQVTIGGEGAVYSGGTTDIKLYLMKQS